MPASSPVFTSPTSPVRVRLAPSPTGYLHIGTAFLMLLNHALVKQHGGKLIIRIEDTDQNRFVADAEQAIYDGLRWLGLPWDEAPDVGGPFAPYRQSERVETYRAGAARLVAEGKAYRCWCSPERLEQMRREQQARKQPPKYDRLCLGKTEEERRKLGGYTERSVIRLLMPDEGHTTFDDLIRGPITFENGLLDDRVLLKSDGFPTYNLAAPFDDHAMGITHITRGEEWIPSTPIHLQVFRAFGWEPPRIAHTPLLLNADKSKISKRRHPWAVISWFRDEGFLPEAMINYLGSLIAHVPDPENPDPSVDKDIFTVEDVVERFDLAKIGPSGKIVDLEKLAWLNGHYIRRFSLPELEDRVVPFMAKAGLDVRTDPRFPRALALEQERLKKLAETPQVLSFFFRDEPYDPSLLVPKGLDRSQAAEYLAAARQIVDEHAAKPGAWKASELEEAFRALAERLGLTSGRQRGQLFGVVRTAVTGRTATPPLFDTMEVLGSEIVQRRMDEAAVKLSAPIA